MIIALITYRSLQLLCSSVVTCDIQGLNPTVFGALQAEYIEMTDANSSPNQQGYRSGKAPFP